MIDLVKYLVSQIVDHPDDIQIEESVDENNTRLITFTVHPDDMGKVIGKGGKIISAIREIVKVKAIKQQERVRVILKDPEGTTTTAETNANNTPSVTDLIEPATQTNSASQSDPQAPPSQKS